ADPTRTFGEKLTIKKVMEDSYERLKNKPLEDHSLNAELYNTISRAFYGMFANDLAFEAANKGLQEVEKSNDIDPLIKVKLLIDRAKTYFVQFDFQTSLNDLENALSVCKQNLQINDCLIDEIYLYEAKNHFKIGNKVIAKDYIEESLIWMKKNNIQGVRFARNLVFLASIQNDLKLADDALINMAELKSMISLNVKEESYYYIDGEIQTIYSLRTQKKNTEAIKKVEELMAIIGNKFGKENALYINVIFARALIHLDLKEYKNAIEKFNEVIELKKKLNINYAYENNKIGNVYYYGIKDYTLAIKYYSEAIRLDRENKSHTTSDSAFFVKNLGYAYYRVNNIKEALKYFIESRKMFTKYANQFPDTIKKLDDGIDFLNQKLVEEN
ncbi:MAG: tetratricopeptide repeat protein, partial [Alcanivoracaceae bacterium]|nr:tetratricopeptide repeat protein [Alcanivoracaceae bacterium]